MEKSRIGIYLGRSTKHSRNVALVLNIKTGRVSPQFQFNMDLMFHTVKNATRQERVQSKWQEAAGFIIGKWKGGETNAKDKRGTQPIQTQQLATPHIPSTKQEGIRLNLPPQPVQMASLSQGSEGVHATPIRTEARPMPQVVAILRPPRKCKDPSRLINAMSAELACQETPYKLFSLESLFPDPEEEHTLLAYKSSADPDTIYMHKAMKEPGAGEFKKAMRGEMDAQIEGKVLELTHINDVPNNVTLLPAVLKMKRKRHIKTRKVYTWKSRLILMAPAWSTRGTTTKRTPP